jgi:hypothetical protein
MGAYERQCQASGAQDNIRAAAGGIKLDGPQADSASMARPWMLRSRPGGTRSEAPSTKGARS